MLAVVDECVGLCPVLAGLPAAQVALVNEHQRKGAVRRQALELPTARWR